MHDHTYTVRFGWTRRDLLLIPACVVFVVVGVAGVADGQPTGYLACVIGGGYIVVSTVAMASRRVALAVTAEGITLGLVPPWPSGRTAFVPWSDIEAVVLWRQHMLRMQWFRQSLGYVGVVRRAGAPPLPGSAKSSMLRRVNAAVVPWRLSEELVADSRPVSFWRLDEKKLAAAVAHFRPDVPVVHDS